MQETGGTPWETGVRVTKTSEDRYIRHDSSSSQSSIDEPVRSPRSTIYNSTAMHQQTIKPEYNRVFILDDIFNYSINFI